MTTLSRKPFTAPVWFMLIFGIAFTALSIVGINVYIQNQLHYNVNYTPGFDVVWQGLRWPALALLESFLYWRIRYRNVYRLDTWLHCWLFALAVVLPNLLAIPAILHLGNSGSLIGARQIIFWILVIVSHICFIDALIKSRRNPPPPPAEDNKENLLDEFVS